MTATPSTTRTDDETGAEAASVKNPEAGAVSTADRAEKAAPGPHADADGADAGDEETKPADAAKSPGAKAGDVESAGTGAEGAKAGSDEDEGVDEDDDVLDDLPPAAATRTGIGAGAAAVVSGALGFASLTGTWTGKVLSERETLLGQIKTAQGGSPAAQIHEIYGDSWHTTAAVNGVFALLALLVGAFVLARPAFGTPGAHPQPVWVRAVALGGVALGVLGIFLSVAMYFDLFAALPTTGS
ncbi:hypothetical protein ACFWXK_16850 [Streptomyces sp. NPDC059070]|uniref:hypothetical protein n=1 Tax=unclassified Streptomyces TaxID=2593676 RepID=UPI0034E2787E